MTATPRTLDAARRDALSMELQETFLIVTIDFPGAPVNTLSPALAGEFEKVFARINDDSLIQGVVLISG
jgi:enoyl-CoA hydratase/carnithine racemase